MTPRYEFIANQLLPYIGKTVYVVFMYPQPSVDYDILTSIEQQKDGSVVAHLLAHKLATLDSVYVTEEEAVQAVCSTLAVKHGKEKLKQKNDQEFERNNVEFMIKARIISRSKKPQEKKKESA